MSFNSLQVGQVLENQFNVELKRILFQFLIGRLGTLKKLKNLSKVEDVSIPYRQARYLDDCYSKYSSPYGFNSLQVGQVQFIISYKKSNLMQFQFLIGRLGTREGLTFDSNGDCFNSLQVGQVPMKRLHKQNSYSVSIPYRQARYEREDLKILFDATFQFLIGRLGTISQSNLPPGAACVSIPYRQARYSDTWIIPWGNYVCFNSLQVGQVHWIQQVG